MITDEHRWMTAVRKSPLTTPASWLYGWVMNRRNAGFDRGRGVQRINRPVISVGNLTTGGTGKTPMVAWICQRLLETGYQPAIAMRGYGATTSRGEVSDEQAEYRDRLGHVPVIAHPNRVAALREFLSQRPEVDCVVLDDGFQHRRIARDLDLVLIDATAAPPTFNDSLLPRGNLREPFSSLKRADAVIVTHAESQISNLKSQIEHYHGRPPIAWTRHAWTHLTIYDKRGPHSQPIQSLTGKRLLTMLGVAKPGSIHNRLNVLGATIAVNLPASDHEKYDHAKLMLARGLSEGCDAMLVTAKDWVKLRDLIDLSAQSPNFWPTPIAVPQLAIEVFAGESDLIDLLLECVQKPSAGEPAG